MSTKAELQSKVERLQREIAALKRHQQRLIDQREEIAAQFSVLASQDNALMHLLDEVFNIEVRPVEVPRGVRWEDRHIVWGFFQRPDGEELHQNESLSEGYRHIWEIEQEVRRMRAEDESIAKP